MYGKHILAIVCSSVLTVAMGTAVAQDNSTAEAHPNGTSESGAGGSQSAMSQKPLKEAMGKPTVPAGSTAQDDGSQGQTMAQSGQAQLGGETSSGTIMAGREVRNRQGDPIGRVAGVVVDDSGRVQAVVIDTAKAGGSGQDQYAVVPRESLQMQSRQPRQSQAMAHSRAAKQQRLMTRMAQQLEMQELEIGLLRQQLAKQQIERQLLGMRNGLGAAHGSTHPGSLENFHAQGNPLSRVDTVIVDRSGRVQAIVLKSGMVLARDQAGGSGAGQQSSEFSRFERQGGQY